MTHECPSVVAPSWAPWKPRHCADCGACEGTVHFVYLRLPSGHWDGTGKRPDVDLVCLDCLRAWRAAQPVQMDLFA